VAVNCQPWKLVFVGVGPIRPQLIMGTIVYLKYIKYIIYLASKSKGAAMRVPQYTRLHTISRMSTCVGYALSGKSKSWHHLSLLTNAALHLTSRQLMMEFLTGSHHSHKPRPQCPGKDVKFSLSIHPTLDSLKSGRRKRNVEFTRTQPGRHMPRRGDKDFLSTRL
jgi:hypothetical protein